MAINSRRGSTMWQKFKKWANVDHLVDLAVDAFLLLFEVISSPVLIVMRIIRWTVGHFFLEGIKNKIKKFIHWIKDKPLWLQIIVIPMVLIILAYVLVFIWIIGEAFGQFIAEEFGDKDISE